MPDPAATAYLGIPGFAWLWVLALASFALFGRQVARYIRVLRAARPEPGET